MEDCKRLAESNKARKSGLDVSGDDITAAWDAIRADSGDDAATNFMVLEYENKNGLKLLARGAGGLGELRDTLDGSRVQYAAFRAYAVDDEGSRRPKFAFVSWVPDGAPAMQRARASQHVNRVKNSLAGLHVDFFCTEKDDLTDDEVAQKIISSSGAHAPARIEF